MLARAFVDDPLARAILPDPARRRVALRRYFALQLRHCYLPRGEVLMVADGAAAALTIGPSGAPIALKDRVASLSLVAIFGRRFLLTRRVARHLAARHPVAAHRYLGTIGTEPTRQGQGLGSELLAAVVERCERDGVSCYLEASTPRNVTLYERFGFAVTAEVDLGLGGVRTWLMRRDVAM